MATTKKRIASGGGTRIASRRTAPAATRRAASTTRKAGSATRKAAGGTTRAPQKMTGLNGALTGFRTWLRGLSGERQATARREFIAAIKGFDLPLSAPRSTASTATRKAAGATKRSYATGGAKQATRGTGTGTGAKRTMKAAAPKRSHRAKQTNRGNAQHQDMPAAQHAGGGGTTQAEHIAH